MIDIDDKTAQEQIRIELIKMMIVQELLFAKRLKPILNRQYIDVALSVRNGYLDIGYLIDLQRKRMIKLFEIQFRKITSTFFKRATKDLGEIKSPIDEFWEQLRFWIRGSSVREVTKINRSTKRMLRNIIQRGMESGKSHKEIAKKIFATGKIITPIRAKTIARTETHTAAVHSLNTVMKNSRKIKEKEWLSAFDERVRESPFNHNIVERIPFDALYQKTGESLMYPGDYYRGSAANIINCRCIEMYHTRTIVEVTA